LVAGSGLQLGIWTWRGVHVAAVELGLRVKGTPYTAADIVVRAADGTPCTSLNKSCPANCDWGPWLGLNHTHPGSKAYYDSFYSQVADDWGVEFVKTDCQDPVTRWEELLLQSEAVQRCNTEVALSIAPGPFRVVDGVVATKAKAVTMYRTTGDFYGRWNQLPAELEAAATFANASLLGQGGVFPDLDMIPMGQICCDLRSIPATTHGQHCGCDNCNGWFNAKLIASQWAIARSPLLIGGALPLDSGTMRILSTPDFELVHTYARNQTVIEYTRPAYPPPQRGWIKWSAELSPGGDPTAVRAVLIVNVGNVSASTVITWCSLGLGLAPNGTYTATDVWSGRVLDISVAKAGFSTTIGRENGTLVIVRRLATYRNTTPPCPPPNAGNKPGSGKPFSLSAVFSHNMVLQRYSPANPVARAAVYGDGASRKQVVVKLTRVVSGEASSTTTITTVGHVDGSWKVLLPSQPAGGNFTLSAAGSDIITLHNVTFGDVWLCSVSNLLIYMSAIR
jgi:hypothetical protein